MSKKPTPLIFREAPRIVRRALGILICAAGLLVMIQDLHAASPTNLATANVQAASFK